MNQPSSCHHPSVHLLSCLRGRAQAAASITGSADHPAISGLVRFFQTNKGVLVCAEIRGLPEDSRSCGARVFGFHIHEGSDCGGSMDKPFSDAMSHYDPNDCPHPQHAGDLPPLFGNDGLALSVFLTSRFSVEEIIGRTIILHDRPDDFTTQPSGNSGTKIACGVIRGPKCSC